MKIKARFMLSHLLAALAPLAILAGVAAVLLERDAKSGLRDKLAVSSAEAVVRIEGVYARNLLPLVTIAHQLGPRLKADPAALSAELLAFQDKYSDFSSIMILAADGRPVAATSSELMGSDFFTDPVVRHAMDGVVANGEVERQALTGRMGFLVAVPLEDDAGKTQGALLAVFDWAPFQLALSGVTILGSRHDYRRPLYVSQGSGLIFSGPRARPQDGIAWAQRVVQPASVDRLEIIAIGNDEFLGSPAPTHAIAGLPDPRWVVHALVRDDVAPEGTAYLRYVTVGVAIGAAGLMLLTGFLLAGQVVDPLRRMAGSFRRISGGETSMVIEGEERDDEIGEMARALKIYREGVTQIVKLSRAVEQSPASVVITDVNGVIEYVNPRFVEATGYAPAEVVGQNPRILKSGFTSSDQYKDMWKVLAEGNDWRGEFHNRRKDGSLFWEYACISPIRGSDGQISHFVAVKEDITARKAYEEDLIHQTSYDQLTDLPNRLLAGDRLEQVLHRATRQNRFAAVIMVDIDRFRTVNDTLGHDAGDELLRQAAARLTGCLRSGDTVARMGGDEFLIVLSDLESPLDVDDHAAKVSECFNQPFLIEGRDVVPGASLGISIFPTDGEGSQVLLKSADTAMHLAKESGRNTRRYFTPDLHAKVSEKLALEEAMHSALEAEEFHLHYHPLVNCETGRATAAEALIRWNSASLGNVVPDVFIPVAEETGLIVAIGEWVVRTVCRDMARWDELGLPRMRVAVNVSMRQLEDRRFIDVVADSLKSNGIDPDRLEIELTERVLLGRDGHTMGLLQEMKDMGLRLSIDDFGTGYSSMSYLTSFPFDVLKIDRSFVSAVMGNRQDAALAQAIIAMAHALDMEVVAEGVEEAEQVEFMRQNGCEFLQGYFFSRPVSFDFFVLLDVVQKEEARQPERLLEAM